MNKKSENKQMSENYIEKRGQVIHKKKEQFSNERFLAILINTLNFSFYPRNAKETEENTLQ